MINILKAEYKKFFKSISFIIILIMTLLLPIFMAGTYKLLESIAAYEEVPIYGNLISPFGAFMTSFNPIDNFGLIILIILVLLMTNDFSSGTIRNKVIGGYSRNQIYLATSIHIFSIIILFTTIYSFLIYLFVSLFVGFENILVIDLLRYYLISILSILVVYAFVQLIVYQFKSLGASLGIILGVLFLGVIIPYSILSMGVSENTNKIILYIFPFLQLFVPRLTKGFDLLIMIIVNLCYFVGLMYLGFKINKKTDYK